MKSILTLQHFDDVIETITSPSTIPEVDAMMAEIAKALNTLKKGQLNLVAELLVMYDSASEYDVDIDRRVIYQLAQRIAGVEPPPPPPA